MERGIDDIVKQVYETGEFEYKEANWRKLQEKLNQSDDLSKPAGILFIGGFSFKRLLSAAAVLVFIGSAIFFVLHQSNHSQSNSSASNHHSTPDTIQVDTVQNNVVIHDTLNTVPSTNGTSSNPKVASNSTNQKVNTTQAPTPEKISNQNIKPIISSTNEKDIANIQVPKKDSVLKLDIKSPIQGIQNQTSPVVSGKKIIQPLPSVLGMDDQDERIKGGFAILGGYGRGVSNTMYTAGLSYTLPVSNHFFIESNVAYSSSNIQNVITIGAVSSSTFNGTSTANNNGALVPSDITISKEQAVEKHIPFAHLSFNPSVGYALSKRFSVKAGIDAQQQITNKEAYGYSSADELYKPLPKTDIGFTPKIGVQLSKHWQSNLMYRKAINHIFTSTDYFNRDYFLLQLGYKF